MPPFRVPPKHIAFLHALQGIVRDTKPPRPKSLAQCTWRQEWRARIIRRLHELAEIQPDFVVVTDGLTHFIMYQELVYRLMAVRPRRAPRHVSMLERLTSNPHRWLLPAAAQVPLFERRDLQPGSEGYPVPLSFDPDGEVLAGWPDFVDQRGVGWGMTRAVRVIDVPLVVEVERLGPAPEELVPDLRIPKLKRKRGPRNPGA